jgi:hypothetical protein
MSSQSPGLMPPNEGDLAKLAIQQLTARLPDDWQAMSVETAVLPQSRRADALIRLAGPDGTDALLVLEVKRLVERRDVGLLAEQLREITRYLPNAYPVVASRYLSPSVREGLTEQQVSYIDATGNIRIATNGPAVFLSDRGEDRDPWRTAGRPRGTLKGAPATRVVRTLLDYRRQWQIRELVAQSGASTGATYRVLEYLEQEDLVRRSGDRKYSVPDWARLLRAWSKDYEFVRSNRVTAYINPRGLKDVLSRAAAGGSIDYAFSGSVAAEQWAPYAPARSAIVYVRDASSVAEQFGLRQTDVGVNVQLAEPDTDMPFRNTSVGPSGVRVVSATQTAVDLMTGPGRNPAEAEELIEWMERNESRWRSTELAGRGSDGPA